MNTNPNDLVNNLKKMSATLCESLGNIGDVLKPMENKKTVHVPINNKVAKLEVTNNNMVYLTIPEATDEDINKLIELFSK